MTALGVRSGTCQRGHPWTEKTTYNRPGGKRTCRRCATERRADSRASQRPEPDVPAPVFRPPEWMELALCAEVDPDLWFPAKGEAAKDAKAICARCPVRAECLDYALAGADTWGGLSYGIWGGTSERERRGKRRERRAAA